MHKLVKEIKQGEKILRSLAKQTIVQHYMGLKSR